MLEDGYAPTPQICSRCKFYDFSIAELPCIECTNPEIGHRDCRYQAAPRTELYFKTLLWIQKHSVIEYALLAAALLFLFFFKGIIK